MCEDFSSHFYYQIEFADMAELADALDLGSSVNRRAGSTPVIRTGYYYGTFISGQNKSSSVVRDTAAFVFVYESEKHKIIENITI